MFISADAQLGERLAFASRLEIHFAGVRLLLQQEGQGVLQALQARRHRLQVAFALRPLVWAKRCAGKLTHLLGEGANLFLKLNTLFHGFLQGAIGNPLARLTITQHPFQTKSKASHAHGEFRAIAQFSAGGTVSFRRRDADEINAFQERTGFSPSMPKLILPTPEGVYTKPALAWVKCIQRK